MQTCIGGGTDMAPQQHYQGAKGLEDEDTIFTAGSFSVLSHFTLWQSLLGRGRRLDVGCCPSPLSIAIQEMESSGVPVVVVQPFRLADGGDKAVISVV